MNVLLPDGRLLRGISPAGLLATVKGRPVPVEKLSRDSDSRRILLVLDNHSSLPDAAWELAVGLASYVVEHARDEDTFALITARGEPEWIPATAKRSSLLARLSAMREGERKKGSRGVLEAIQQGLQEFDGKPGDSVLLIAADERATGEVTYESVLEALQSRKMRLFTLYLAEPLMGTYRIDFDPTYPFAPGMTSYFRKNRKNVGFLTEESGGGIFIEPTDDPKITYRPTPERKQFLQQMLWRMYGAMAEHYEVTFRATPGAFLSFALTQELDKRFPHTALFYPRHVPACVPQGKKAPEPEPLSQR